MPVYCSEAVASVALRAGRFGYTVHGHDVKLRVCVRSLGLLDLSRLYSLVSEVASKYSHRPLWETLCSGDPLIEHLAAKVLSEVTGSLGDVVEGWIEAEVPEGRIIVSLEETESLWEECK